MELLEEGLEQKKRQRIPLPFYSLYELYIIKN